MRALYLPWDLALHERDRLLDDLQAFTRIDTIMLLDLYSTRLRTGTHGVTYHNSQAALPPTTRFNFPVRMMSAEDFAGIAEFMKTARSRGFKIASLIAPLFIPAAGESMACVDFTGRKLLGPKDSVFYGCPNPPGVVDYGQTFLKGLIASWPEMDYLSLDHLEYPINLFTSYPNIDLRDLFVCFCESCQTRAREEGFDLEVAKEEVASLFRLISSPRPGTSPEKGTFSSADILAFLVNRPHLMAWLDFRRRSMTRYARSMLDACRDASSSRGSKPRIGFYFQLPSLSGLVGTDYEGLFPLFDYACVKFPDYIPGSVLPLVADKISEKTGARDKMALRSAMRELLDLGPGPTEYEPLGGMKDVLLYSNATDPSMVERQIRRISGLKPKTKIIPHVWEHNGDVASLRAKIEVLKGYGFRNYTVWAFEDGLTRKNLRAARGVL